jgi:hypothetical protein
VPTTPEAVVVELIFGTGGAATVIVRVAVPVPPALDAPKLTTVVAASLGVPEISPVTQLNVRFAGSGDAENIKGVFVATIVYVKAVPTVPLAVVRLVMTGGGGSAGATVSVSVAVPVPPALIAPNVIS